MPRGMKTTSPGLIVRKTPCGCVGFKLRHRRCIQRSCHVPVAHRGAQSLRSTYGDLRTTATRCPQPDAVRRFDRAGRHVSVFGGEALGVVDGERFAVNDPPATPSLSDQTAFVGQLFNYTVLEALDPDSSALTYDAFLGEGKNPLPSWLDFDAATRAFSGAPLEADIATHEILVSVSDDLHTTSATFQLAVVLPANRPPTASTFWPQTATEDYSLFYQALAFQDPDDDALTHTSALDGGGSLPAWLTFTANTDALIFSGDPREADTPATLTIRVTATDGSLSASATFTLIVVEVNDPPTANAGPDQTVGEGDTVTLDGSRSIDSEDLPLACAWTQSSGPSVALSGADTISPVFTPRRMGWPTTRSSGLPWW